MYLDGVERSYTIYTNLAASFSFPNFTGDSRIGLSEYQSTPADGHYDDWVVVRGKALWTSNFTPPAREQ